MGFGHRAELRLERVSSEIQYIAHADSIHEFVDEILNESDMEQIQYMVGERTCRFNTWLVSV